jgi:patatin-like phospholipase/acyl hydrolase
MPRRYLLSIDGGGIRGIIPAAALVKLEKTTGKLTRDIFSFVAGTSTGAILAAAVAAGVPAIRILDLYTNRAREIFTQSPLKIFRRIFFGSMYSVQSLHDLIAEEIGGYAWKLNDSPIDILLTAKRISDGMPWYFVRDNPMNSGCTGRLSVADCATASAAAPTYFDPWTIAEELEPSPPCERVGTLVDGAVGVTGNPVYQACIEAFEFTPDYNPEETITVSLGTGRYKSRKEPKWIGAWLEWIMVELLESPGEQQTEITQRQFPEMTFYRIDTELKENIGLDDPRKIERLLEYGERLAETIDWEAILAGKETRFRIGRQNTLWEQYKVNVV